MLDALASQGSVTKAAEIVGIERKTHYRWLQDEPAYQAGVEEALADFELRMRDLAAQAEKAAFERTINGAPEFIPNPHTGIVRDKDGKPIVQRRFNEQLTIALLRAHKPEKYREESRLSITGKLEFSKPEINVVLVKEVLSSVDWRALPAPPALEVIEGEARELDEGAALESTPRHSQENRTPSHAKSEMEEGGS